MAGVLAALVGAPMAAHGHFQEPPRAEITAGPQGQVAETTATFEFRATGFAPLSSFECRVDAVAWEPCRSPFTVGELDSGPHVFEVRLVGEWVDSSPDRRDWTVATRTEVLPCGGDACAAPMPEPEPAASPPPPRSHRRRDADGCAYGANEPGEVSRHRIRQAVRCLVNLERTDRGLRPLRRNRRLEAAARRHARDMVVRAYFSHASPAGRRVTDRVRASGYLRGARHWSVGEVLAWLVRPRPTPAEVVEAWMRSRPHREVLLRRSFREIGVDFARGNPRVERDSGATFAAALGHRAR